MLNKCYSLLLLIWGEPDKPVSVAWSPTGPRDEGACWSVEAPAPTRVSGAVCLLPGSPTLQPGPRRPHSHRLCCRTYSRPGVPSREFPWWWQEHQQPLCAACQARSKPDQVGSMGLSPALQLRKARCCGCGRQWGPSSPGLFTSLAWGGGTAAFPAAAPGTQVPIKALRRY